MKRNNFFSRFIIVTLTVALLLTSGSKAIRVKAVGTTVAASAAAALCAVGAIYCSYMALTGASVHIPSAVEDISGWLSDIGTKVVQYPSGRAAYEEIYPQILGPGSIVHDFLDSEVWTWTADKLKDWANDFSSTNVISNIVSYEEMVDISNVPTNGFAYSFEFSQLSDVIVGDGLGTETFESLQTQGWTFTWPTGTRFINSSLYNGETTFISFPTWLTGTYRNYLGSDGYYRVQQLVNGTWTNVNSYNWSIHMDRGSSHFYVRPDIAHLRYNFYTWDANLDSTYYTYPPLPNEQIYDSTQDRYLPMVIPDSLVTYGPHWPELPPEDDNKPVVPYVKLPYDPSWIDPVTNLPGGGNWGFNLGRLLDVLEDLAGLMMEIGAIGELINDFKDLVGDNYYIYYNEGDDYYYEYYTITNFGDNIYNYDIDVSDTDHHLPVDLNSIVTYSDNRYLAEVKKSAEAGSSIIRDLVVFWYDIDPTIIYIFAGCSITVLIAAFIGKWGHS